jgi:beta-lactamase class A
MLIHRRGLLAIAPALLASPAPAAPTPFPALADYERLSGGRIGLFARNTVTGATLAWRADERFVMCSTFKASLAALALTRVDHGHDSLDAPIAFGAADIGDMYAPVAKANLARGQLSVEQMCAGAVEQSDNVCAVKLLARVGGPPALTAFWRSIGDGVSRLDHTEPLLNRTPPGGVEDTTTPRAMAETVRRMVLGDVLAPVSRQRLTTWMIACQTGADRLRGGLPAAWTIGDKTGNNGKDAAGDLAVAWPSPGRPIVIAAYTRGGAPNQEQLAAVFAAIGREAAARLA